MQTLPDTTSRCPDGGCAVQHGDMCLLYGADMRRDYDGTLVFPMCAADSDGYYRYDFRAWVSKYERKAVYGLA